MRSRKPPWYSYQAVITESASRALRSVSGTAPASASGRRRSPSMAVIPADESVSASVAHVRQTAPPARGE